MKILHVSPTSFSKHSIIGGGERYLSYIMSAVFNANAQRTNIDQSIVSLTDEEFAQDIKTDADHHFVLGYASDVGTIEITKLRQIIKAHDVIHVHQCLSNFGIFVASHAKILRRATIGTDHGGGESALLDWNPSLASVFDLFHAQSNFAQLGFSRFKVPVETIFGPIDESLYPLRERHLDSQYLVSAGRIMPHKGFDHVVRAMPTDLEYRIIGQPYDQEYLGYISRLADEHGKKVTFIHDADDTKLQELIRGALLYIQPSVPLDYRANKHKKSELLGLSSLEALAMGVPILVNNQTALGELSVLPGAFSYQSVQECRAMLLRFKTGMEKLPSPDHIRTAMIEKYGLGQFGRAYAQIIGRIV